jgi:hypothetical protein
MDIALMACVVALLLLALLALLADNQDGSVGSAVIVLIALILVLVGGFVGDHPPLGSVQSNVLDVMSVVLLCTFIRLIIPVCKEINHTA